MNASPPDAAAVAATFRLGRPRSPLTPVAGGLSHRMWRLETDGGVYAVKELNRDFSNPHYLKWYERAFRVEMAAYEAGVPMPRPVPLPGTGACVAELPGRTDRPVTVRVHAWVDGRSPAPAAVTEDLAAQVGALLARVHALPLIDDDELPQDRRPLYGVERWQALAQRAEAAGLAWAARLREVLPQIGEIEAQVAGAAGAPDRRVMAHRDVDQKNVLVTPAGTLRLVDWDAAGPDRARAELVNVALDWAGAFEYEPEPRLMRAVVRGYRAAGGDLEGLSSADVARFYRVYVEWTAYNVRRALGERLQDEERRRIADGEVRLMLAALPRFYGAAERWVVMMRDA